MTNEATRDDLLAMAIELVEQALTDLSEHDTQLARVNLQDALSYLHDIAAANVGVEVQS